MLTKSKSLHNLWSVKQSDHQLQIDLDLDLDLDNTWQKCPTWLYVLIVFLTLYRAESLKKSCCQGSICYKTNSTFWTEFVFQNWIVPFVCGCCEHCTRNLVILSDVGSLSVFHHGCHANFTIKVGLHPGFISRSRREINISKVKCKSKKLCIHITVNVNFSFVIATAFLAP